MAKAPSSPKSKKDKPASPLMVRLDEASKTCLVQAAELRRLSVSDYVRAVTVAQARREVLAARQQTIALTPEEQPHRRAAPTGRGHAGRQELPGHPYRLFLRAKRLEVIMKGS